MKTAREIAAAEAAKIASRKPWLSAHVERALRVLGGVVETGPGHFFVTGESAGYHVVLSREHRTTSCTCPAWRYSKQYPAVCKHLIACHIVTVVREESDKIAKAEREAKIAKALEALLELGAAKEAVETMRRELWTS